MKFLSCFFIFICALMQADDYKVAVELLKNKQYEKADQHFKLASHSPEHAKSAFFGRVLCDVALGKYEKIEKHMKKVNVISCCDRCESDEEPKKNPTTAAEQYALYLCRQEVRKLSQNLRSLVEKLIAETVSGIFKKIQVLRQLNPYIDNLERNGMTCCQNGETSECCIEPLVRQLELWNSDGLHIKDK